MLSQRISNIRFMDISEYINLEMKSRTVDKHTKMYAGISPYAFDEDGRQLFLVGREKPSKKAHISNKWSDFGGKPEESDISEAHSAAREGYEETMGMLGNFDDILELIESNAHQAYSKGIKGSKDRIVVYPVEIDYDPGLPLRFSDVYRYVREGVSQFHETRQKGYFEKTSIALMDLEDILEFPEEYRPCYQRTFRDLISKTTFSS